MTPDDMTDRVQMQAKNQLLLNMSFTAYAAERSWSQQYVEVGCNICAQQKRMWSRPCPKVDLHTTKSSSAHENRELDAVLK